MTWREQLTRVTMPDGRRLIGASFRGVPFFVAVAERSGGRRGVLHEFPFRDKPFFRDLGRAAGRYRIEGYVLGDDYLTQRDVLIAALEGQAVPGELVHPYYGRLRGVCPNFNVRTSTADGGMALFAIDFLEDDGKPLAPTEFVDHPAKVAGSADAALDAIDEDFLAAYDVGEQPSFALESLSEELSGLADTLGDALEPVTTGTQELAKLSQQVEILTAQASSLIRKPAEITSSFLGAIRQLAESAAEAPGAIVKALVETYGAAAVELAPDTTSTRKQERANQTALSEVLRRIIAIEAARLVPTVDFETLEQATDDRDAVLELLDEQAETAGDQAYPALVQLRADLALAVPGDALLARIQTVERRVAVPSLLLAYQLYGSVELEADIIARNAVRHPAFISGSLKVLSNG